MVAHHGSGRKRSLIIVLVLVLGKRVFAPIVFQNRSFDLREQLTPVWQRFLAAPPIRGRGRRRVRERMRTAAPSFSPYRSPRLGSSCGVTKKFNISVPRTTVSTDR